MTNETKSDNYQNNYKVHVDNIFEGPMDLLVHLIKKNEVDIYNIPVALITDQYLEYIKWMESMNIDFAGDFLVMASTLAHIKSKMLLPPSGIDDEDEDPRDEIARPLAEYLQMKNAAEQLAERNLLWQDIFPKGQKKDNDLIDPDDQVIQVGLFELIDAFQNILKNVSPDVELDFTSDKISVKDRINELVDILDEKGTITFTELFGSSIDKSAVIVTFLALLEMVKITLVQIVQHIQSGIIRIIYL